MFALIDPLAYLAAKTNSIDKLEDVVFLRCRQCRRLRSCRPFAPGVMNSAGHLNWPSIPGDESFLDCAFANSNVEASAKLLTEPKALQQPTPP